jgi:hypothetical protein
MRHGVDFIDLQSPKVRHPTVGLEQRIVIGAEMYRAVPFASRVMSMSMS